MKARIPSKILKKTREESEVDFVLNLCPREIVEVRSENEILATLDKKGTLEGLPFMPEMRIYCGKRFRVLNRISKLMVEGIGIRQIKSTVVLEGVTCDGEAHFKCKRTCMILWKEAWLKRVQRHSNKTRMPNHVFSNAKTVSTRKDQIVSCQSVNLIKATSKRYTLIWRLEQLLLDIRCKTLRSQNYVDALLTSLNFKLRHFLSRKNQLAIRGRLRRTPTVSLYLQPGELVEVRSEEEILATLDVKGRNRGLGFGAEMLKYCGKRYRVLKRVDAAINEETGKLRQINNTIILEGATCDGTAHGDCKRNCYCLWREIWLKRV